MVLCVPDSSVFVVIKAVVKWPFCLLPQRLVFQYPEQMVCVFRGWITEQGGLLRSRAYTMWSLCVCVLLPQLREYTCVSELYIHKKRLWIHWFPVLFSSQTLEEPPYLTVGTDVSAKYRGAFCEAKIKTAKRLVKAKVSHISKWSWSGIKYLSSVSVVREVGRSRARWGAPVFVRKGRRSRSHSSALMFVQLLFRRKDVLVWLEGRAWKFAWLWPLWLQR